MKGKLPELLCLVITEFIELWMSCICGMNPHPDIRTSHVQDTLLSPKLICLLLYQVLLTWGAAWYSLFVYAPIYNMTQRQLQLTANWLSWEVVSCCVNPFTAKAVLFLCSELADVNRQRVTWCPLGTDRARDCFSQILHLLHPEEKHPAWIFSDRWVSLWCACPQNVGRCIPVSVYEPLGSLLLKSTGCTTESRIR